MRLELWWVLFVQLFGSSVCQAYYTKDCQALGWKILDYYATWYWHRLAQHAWFDTEKEKQTNKNEYVSHFCWLEAISGNPVCLASTDGSAKLHYTRQTNSHLVTMILIPLMEHSNNVHTSLCLKVLGPQTSPHCLLPRMSLGNTPKFNLSQRLRKS